MLSLTHYESAKISVSHRDRCEDRIAIFGNDERMIVIVADGAGGVGSGDAAASTVIREVEAEYSKINSADQWTTLLK